MKSLQLQVASVLKYGSSYCLLHTTEWAREDTDDQYCLLYITEWEREDTDDQDRWWIPLTVHVNIQFVNIQQNTITVLVYNETTITHLT